MPSRKKRVSKKESKALHHYQSQPEKEERQSAKKIKYEENGKNRLAKKDPEGQHS